MSSGMDCFITEKSPGVWHYSIQVNHDPEEDYDKQGPFATLDAVKRHLNRNYGNPGGYCVEHYAPSK
jgi:hypothetical protein